MGARAKQQMAGPPPDVGGGGWRLCRGEAGKHGDSFITSCWDPLGWDAVERLPNDANQRKVGANRRARGLLVARTHARR